MNPGVGEAVVPTAKRSQSLETADKSEETKTMDLRCLKYVHLDIL